jgi:hypothetical protein
MILETRFLPQGTWKSFPGILLSFRPGFNFLPAALLSCGLRLEIIPCPAPPTHENLLAEQAVNN